MLVVIRTAQVLASRPVNATFSMLEFTSTVSLMETCRVGVVVPRTLAFDEAAADAAGYHLKPCQVH